MTHSKALFPNRFVGILGLLGLGLIWPIAGATGTRSRPYFFYGGFCFLGVLGFPFGHDSMNSFSQLFPTI